MLFQFLYLVCVYSDFVILLECVFVAMFYKNLSILSTLQLLMTSLYHLLIFCKVHSTTTPVVLLYFLLFINSNKD